MKSGSIAIIGAPNVGKSTLINRLLGRKIAIVSDKPQTTRHRILGCVRRPGAEIALLDTPGIHRPRFGLNRRIVRIAKNALDDVDIIFFMIEAKNHPGAQDRIIIELLKERRLPVVLLINKIDVVKKPKLLPLIDECRALFRWLDVVPISAKTGDNVDRLLDSVVPHLPEDRARVSWNEETDYSKPFMAAELIREKLLIRTREELPYSIAVFIQEFVEEPTLLTVAATILVERENQKAIVIGRQGAMLKAVGTEARREMEQRFGKQVFLSLFVQVKAAWRNDDRTLVELGY